MKRRSFLAMLGLAPAVAVASSSAAVAVPESIRIPVSMLKPDAVITFEDGKLTIANANVEFTRLASRDGRLVITPGQITIGA